MADALASGASVRKDVGVQVPPPTPEGGEVHGSLGQSCSVGVECCECFIQRAACAGLELLHGGQSGVLRLLARPGHGLRPCLVGSR